ncbi:unnamed protein product [Vitrella brassicaformis CCMP3155]|uniref:Uncharacterized protein n=1 Tax=Vitrella brassicaformis (strain CCMP3155) TaxID=1169540 RepID=A0A0G4GN35_VITBC|nr:unnamed protein product [Vitrella brassicaformis CCMP3155]|eukprot:CEM31611.1 unnamed protein product [Vitrella brassicaformis CCMP3155]
MTALPRAAHTQKISPRLDNPVEIRDERTLNPRGISMTALTYRPLPPYPSPCNTHPSSANHFTPSCTATSAHQAVTSTPDFTHPRFSRQLQLPPSFLWHHQRAHSMGYTVCGVWCAVVVEMEESGQLESRRNLQRAKDGKPPLPSVTRDGTSADMRRFPLLYSTIEEQPRRPSKQHSSVGSLILLSRVLVFHGSSCRSQRCHGRGQSVAGEAGRESS